MFKKQVFVSVILVLAALLMSIASPATGVDAAKPPTPTPSPMPGALTQIQVYGAWHCGNDACTWSTVRDRTDFDLKNHWIIDRGDGKPSVNLIILSFVEPLKLLNQVTDAGTDKGVPRGMTDAVVTYFTSHNIR